MTTPVIRTPAVRLQRTSHEPHPPHRALRAPARPGRARVRPGHHDHGRPARAAEDGRRPVVGSRARRGGRAPSAGAPQDGEDQSVVPKARVNAATVSASLPIIQQIAGETPRLTRRVRAWAKVLNYSERELGRARDEGLLSSVSAGGSPQISAMIAAGDLQRYLVTIDEVERGIIPAPDWYQRVRRPH